MLYFPCRKFILATLLIHSLTTGCTQNDLFDSDMIEQPRVGQVTQSSRMLSSLPPAAAPVAVSVYAFEDLTGQLKPNTQFADYSRAVTQGGLSILNKALYNAGNGTWFTVVERGGLKNLLQERQIINLMREEYAMPDGRKLERLPPMLYGALLIEGGIVGYDSNVVTGGAGMKYLGIGGDVKHQRDIVTVDLRAINISNGQVILSVTSEKTIYSTGVNGSVFKYISFDKLLEAETGFTMNEPPQLAVRQAVESAVYSLIMEGARRGVWHFADPKQGIAALTDYNKRLADAGDTTETATPVRDLRNQVDHTQIPENAMLNDSSNVTAEPEREKNAIIKDVHEKLSFGDDVKTNRPAENPYPVAPAPQPPRGRP